LASSETRNDGGEKKLCWGILGTARIAHDYVIPAILQSGNGRVEAIAGRSRAKVDSFAAKFGARARYASYDELLASPDVDAVYVPVTNELHCEWTVKAAEKKKHVLCEKPLARSSAECREMVSACAANDVLLMEGFMYRFHPQLDALLREVDSGAIGKVRLVRSSYWFKLDDPGDFRYRREKGGGALMDLGCYCVNVSRALLRSEPSSCLSRSKLRDDGAGVDEVTLAVMDFPGSRGAAFDCGFAAPLYNSLQVVGSEGVLELPEAFEFPQRPRMLFYANNSPLPAREVEFPKVNPYALMVEHFADCVIEGRAPRLSAAEDAINNVRALELLRAEQG
jgi:xylose dehydrogenase (NAD/NADP)